MPMMPPPGGNRMMPPPAAASAGPPPATATGMGGPPQEGPGGGGGGAIPRLVFGIEGALDTLAQAVPQASGEINQVKTMLRGILQKAVSGGAPSPMPGGPPPGGPMGSGSALAR